MLCAVLPAGRFTFTGPDDMDGYDDSESEYSNSAGGELYDWGDGESGGAESTLKPFYACDDMFEDDTYDDDGEEVVYLDSADSRRNHSLWMPSRGGGEGDRRREMGHRDVGTSSGGTLLTSLVPLSTSAGNKRHTEQQSLQRQGGEGMGNSSITSNGGPSEPKQPRSTSASTTISAPISSRGDSRQGGGKTTTMDMEGEGVDTGLPSFTSLKHLSI